MYWRLLSSNPTAAKQVVMGEKPPITAESEKLDPITLEEMCLVVGTLATVYLKPVHTVFRSARPRKLQDSAALQREKLPSYQAAQQAREFSAKNSVVDGIAAAPGAAGAGAHNGDVLNDADAYFASVSGPQQIAAMRLNDDGFAGSPTTAGYTVSANDGRGGVGGGEGDLLSL